jgi:hypothetical protein
MKDTASGISSFEVIFVLLLDLLVAFMHFIYSSLVISKSAKEVYEANANAVLQYFGAKTINAQCNLVCLPLARSSIRLVFRVRTSSHILPEVSRIPKNRPEVVMRDKRPV